MKKLDKHYQNFAISNSQKESDRCETGFEKFVKEVKNFLGRVKDKIGKPAYERSSYFANAIYNIQETTHAFEPKRVEDLQEVFNELAEFLNSIAPAGYEFGPKRYTLQNAEWSELTPQDSQYHNWGFWQINMAESVIKFTPSISDADVKEMEQEIVNDSFANEVNFALSEKISNEGLKVLQDVDPKHPDLLMRHYASDLGELIKGEIKNECVVFDIDGTLAQMTDKRHPDPRERPFAWNKVDTDIVKTDVVWLLGILEFSLVDIIIVTGRDGVCHEKTKKWLQDNGIKYTALFQRPVDNNEKDSVIKKRIFDHLIDPYWNVRMVFDDRNQVVDMWRKDLGISCCQVDYGDF